MRNEARYEPAGRDGDAVSVVTLRSATDLAEEAQSGWLARARKGTAW